VTRVGDLGDRGNADNPQVGWGSARIGDRLANRLVCRRWRGRPVIGG
jgi:hypothetical protein